MSIDTDDEALGGETGRLLVVDDDESNRDLLARRLERRGHAVVVADGGPEALRLVAARPFDVVLLDVMMPGMSGLEVLGALRREHPPSELPVIMATARGQSEDIVEALRMGASDYVTKPLDFPVVLARVRTQLVMKRAVDEAARLERRLAERNRELEAANRRMARDLAAAAKVQASFLPRRPPLPLPGAACAWHYRPCEELAGDGLNAFPVDDRRSALYVFDVCGHGVVASLLSVSLSRVLSPPGDPSSVLTRSGGGLASPAEVAEVLNRMFPFEQADQYFTMAYGLLTVGPDGSGELRYVSAGHPAVLVASARGGVAAVDGRGFPVGLAEAPYTEQVLAVGPGDRVYLYSDGVPEAMDDRGRAFGTGRLIDAVGRGRSRPLPDAVEALVDEVARWSGPAGLRDDVSVLAVEVGAGVGAT